MVQGTEASRYAVGCTEQDKITQSGAEPTDCTEEPGLG